jgi:hypothetical protein
MKETYLLLNGELDNDLYDALFSFEEKRTGIVDQVFLYAGFNKNISITALLTNINSECLQRG